MLLDKQLNNEEKAYLLKELFDLYIDDGVITYCDGVEFYKFDSNTNHSFDTLRGIIKYAEFLAKKKGCSEAQTKMQIALGITG